MKPLHEKGRYEIATERQKYRAPVPRDSWPILCAWCAEQWKAALAAVRAL